MPRSQLPTKLGLICAMLSPVILTSCATTTASSVPTDRVFCSVSQPIYWSKNDTDKTIAAIKESNAAWKAICAAKAAKTSGVTFKDRWFGGEKLQVTAFR